MKHLIFSIFMCTILSSCHVDDPEETLRSILKIDDLSQYDYKYKLVRKKYEMYPFTIYYKINIDSNYYENLKCNHFENLVGVMVGSNFKFQSNVELIKRYDDIKELEIPDWMIKNKNIDVLIYYTDKSKRKYNAITSGSVYLLYYHGYCYIIYNAIIDG